jgi:hypothetical protein
VFLLPLIDDSRDLPDLDDTPVLLRICPAEERSLDGFPIPVAVVGPSPQGGGEEKRAFDVLGLLSTIDRPIDEVI